MAKFLLKRRLRKLLSFIARLPLYAAEAAYRRWPRIVRSPVGVPARRRLARALLGSSLFDAQSVALVLGAETPHRVAEAWLVQPPAQRPSPQPMFDAEAYRARCGLSPQADAFLHAVVRAREGAPLKDGFDPALYLDENSDVRLSGAEPLRHYLLRGRFEQRVRTASPPPMHEGEPLDWGTLPARDRRPKAINVIVPVHGGRAETLTCLHRVLAAKGDLPHRLLVVDDRSPDPILSAELVGLRDAGLIALIVNAQNLGFSGAVNRALAACPEDDAVLLNSDTEVFDHWLDRLHATAHSASDVGTVTPLSNAATILSYPIRLRDNPAPLEIGWAALDRMVAAQGHGPVELPTAVGFCMYIRRDCLDQVGALDAEAFPRGYGEENDFCLRAATLGWRHLAAADTFVFHHGAVSFASARAQLVQQGLAVIDRRYPDYRSRVDAFIRADPLAGLRTAVDCARLRERHPSLRLSHALQASNEMEEAQLVLDPASATLTIRSALATPNLPALNPVRRPRESEMLLSRLGLAQLRLGDRPWLGDHLAAALEGAAVRAGAAVVHLPTPGRPGPVEVS